MCWMKGAMFPLDKPIKYWSLDFVPLIRFLVAHISATRKPRALKGSKFQWCCPLNDSGFFNPKKICWALDFNFALIVWILCGQKISTCLFNICAFTQSYQQSGCWKFSASVVQSQDKFVALGKQFVNFVVRPTCTTDETKSLRSAHAHFSRYV